MNHVTLGHIFERLMNKVMARGNSQRKNNYWPTNKRPETEKG